LRFYFSRKRSKTASVSDAVVGAPRTRRRAMVRARARDAATRDGDAARRPEKDGETARIGTCAEVELVTDERKAGEMWRAERFREFRWRVRCAGLEGDPRFVEILNRMGGLTRELAEMDAKQREDGTTAPWWRDGEYDETRAEEANDRGMARMKKKEYEKAFDEFTEAIRLEPRKAVYHANRSAAALKLERFRAAAEDAACAIERDSRYVKALLRGASAQLKLRCPEKALELFEAVLEIDPEDESASRGRLEAERAAAAAKAEVERQRDAAKRGARTALPRHDVDRETAAEALLSAEALLRANPSLEGARANVAEALVCCQRYEAAIKQCETLLEDSLDRKYIVAETRWRMGDVDGALAEISSASFRDSYDEFASKKCIELGARLLHLQDLIKRAERDVEDEQHSNAIRLLSKLLQTPEGEMTTRFRGRILRVRAECQFKRHEYAAVDDPDACADLATATQDLAECLSLNGNDYEAYALRAAIRTARGDHQGAFTDLRAAQTIAPTHPGVDDAVRRAAARALRGSSADADDPESRDYTVEDGNTRRRGKFYDILGVEPGADVRAVKSAYRKLAAVWHPDKWTRASPEDAAKAEATFKSVQRAYATLSDAKQRKLYDLDPARFDEREL